jgi:hypothetical protein
MTDGLGWWTSGPFDLLGSPLKSKDGLNGARGCLFDSLRSPLKPKDGLNGHGAACSTRLVAHSSQRMA